MGGKIDAYLDCASPYSYFAILHLRKNRPLLEQYGVEVEFHPIFLGGINVATGNKPPSTLPARAKYGPYDLKRAVKYFNTEPLSSPAFFPLLSLLPQRSILYIKHHYPRDQFETTFLSLWTYTFSKHIKLSDPANLEVLLSDTSVGNVFSATEIHQILAGANSPAIKAELTNTTKKLVDEYGAYGAPWFWLRNDQTKQEEPVFGSDRWVYIWEFLGVEWRDVEIVDQRERKGRGEGEDGGGGGGEGAVRAKI